MAAGEQHPRVDPLDYRRTIARFATGVSIVTSRHVGGDVATTVNSLTSVSLDPLLVLFCIDRATRFHDAVIAAGVWAVSVLTVADEPASRWFATRGRWDEARLSGFSTSPGAVTGLPIFSDSIAWLECQTWATYDGGDHTIVVGEVLAATAPPDRAAPLLYFESRYRALPD